VVSGKSSINPVLVWRKWTAATRVKKPKSRTAGFSASEMGRARETVQQQDERIRELEEELAEVREQSAPAKTLDDWCDFFSLGINKACTGQSETDRRELHDHIQQASRELVADDEADVTDLPPFLNTART
jgi:hypothetical protein